MKINKAINIIIRIYVNKFNKCSDNNNNKIRHDKIKLKLKY